LDEPRKREDESLKLSAVKRELKKLFAERERERFGECIGEYLYRNKGDRVER
jgi:hypothetical protein